MKKFLVGIILMIAMATSALAVQPWGGAGWGTCAVSGDNYGGIDGNPCYVAWDPSDGICPDGNKDATFTVGQAGYTTTKITIKHLDGIAESMDAFQVLDGNTVVCSFLDPVGGAEVWKTLVCDNLNLNGEKTLTLHPLAQSAWSLCGTYGQVAISEIDWVGNQIPEFGTIAAMVALAGAVTAFFVVRKH